MSEKKKTRKGPTSQERYAVADMLQSDVIASKLGISEAAVIQTAIRYRVASVRGYTDHFYNIREIANALGLAWPPEL